MSLRGPRSWNATEVYRRDAAGHWRIVHTHWSLTRIGPKLDEIAAAAAG